MLLLISESPTNVERKARKRDNELFALFWSGAIALQQANYLHFAQDNCSQLDAARVVVVAVVVINFDFKFKIGNLIRFARFNRPAWLLFPIDRLLIEGGRILIRLEPFIRSLAALTFLCKQICRLRPLLPPSESLPLPLARAFKHRNQHVADSSASTCCECNCNFRHPHGHTLSSNSNTIEHEKKSRHK